jgi:cobalamin-dependent methionine synthase I
LQKLLPNIYTKSKKGNLGLCSEVLSTDDMIAETYKGIRPALVILLVLIIWKTYYLKLLNVEEEIGVTLTESMAMARIISIRLLFWESRK